MNLVRPAIAVLIAACVLISKPAGAVPFLWEADTGLGGITDKAEINQYLDNLQARGINGVWLQVEFYGQGAVNYKKTELSGLPTIEKFTTGQWAEDDFLAYTTAQAKSRGMSVIIKFHGSDHSAWDKNPDWRKRNSKGEEVLWNGVLKNFCVNSPYWEKTFSPMLREIAANYDVDGFYLDTCQVAYESDDSCFCPQCRARFEQETGKKLPLQPVDRKNWTDPAVKAHAIKRVEWLNEFFEKYGKTVHESKPGAIALLNVSGGYNSYKDALSSRTAGKFVTYMTPEPVNTPRMWAVSRNRRLSQAGEKPVDEMKLAMEEIVPHMNRFGYHEFMVKAMLADGRGKPVIPFSRYWFTEEEVGHTGPVDLEILQIESAIGAGAKGFCFFGYLANAMQKDKVKGTAWDDPRFVAYLKDLTAGPRAKWIADMQPDARIAILYDRDADFWTGDYWQRMKSVGGLFAALQFEKKLPTVLISTSEGMDGSEHRLTAETLAGYPLVIAPGLDFVTKEDLEALRDYVHGGGNLIVMGPVGRNGKFLGQPLVDEAYEILGLSTPGEAEPSGFLRNPGKHPMFMVPTAFSGPMKTSRVSEDKNASLTYKVKHDDKWEILLTEINDNGSRPAILSKFIHGDKIGNLYYFNSDMVAGFTIDLRGMLINCVQLTQGAANAQVAQGLSSTASMNAFSSVDGLAKYLHIVSPEGESGVRIRIRPNIGMTPVSAEIINGGGNPQPVNVVQAQRVPKVMEMTVTPAGLADIRLPDVKPGFAMLRIQYKEREAEPES